MKQFDLIFISKIEEENKFFKYLQTANISSLQFFSEKIFILFYNIQEIFSPKVLLVGKIIGGNIHQS